jgi:hypothetical protein
MIKFNKLHKRKGENFITLITLNLNSKRSYYDCMLEIGWSNIHRNKIRLEKGGINAVTKVIACINKV